MISTSTPNSNTTLVKVKFNKIEIARRLTLIQIQHLLKLNGNNFCCWYADREFKYNTC